MTPYTFPFGSTPDWLILCRRFADPAGWADGAGMTSRPLLVRRDGRIFVTDTFLWCRPTHWLEGGAVCGADLSTRPDYRRTDAEPGEHARWLLHEASRQASLSETPLTLSLPMPSGLAYDTDLLRHAEAALEVWTPERRTLELLLSEHDVAQAGADVLLALSALRDFGFGLALECGRDAAGLARLRRLPLTCLRLPAGLVGDLLHSQPARLAAAQAVREAVALNATVMAQGVRTIAQRDILADLGCDCAHGALFGPAMPAATFQAALLRDLPV